MRIVNQTPIRQLVGASTCSTTKAQWTSISDAIASAADSSQDITGSDVTNILAAVSVTAQ